MSPPWHREFTDITGEWVNVGPGRWVVETSDGVIGSFRVVLEITEHRFVTALFKVNAFGTDGWDTPFRQLALMASAVRDDQYEEYEPDDDDDDDDDDPFGGFDFTQLN